jgi:GAF domain-containing protein
MLPSTNHSKSYSTAEVLQELEAILTGRWITDLANVSALLMNHYKDINWVGFYLVPEGHKEIMWLGPFQGMPACTEIPFSKGVCGAAASHKKTMRVEDVDQLPCHIYCDSRSRSEVVVPLIKNGEVIGVLDVDSATVNRFSEDDQAFFEKTVSILMKKFL